MRTLKGEYQFRIKCTYKSNSNSHHLTVALNFYARVGVEVIFVVSPTEPIRPPRVNLS